MTRLPQAGGQPDLLALLVNDLGPSTAVGRVALFEAAGTHLQEIKPAACPISGQEAKGVTGSIFPLPGENPRAILGFWAKDGGDPSTRSDPRLAVVTTTKSGGRVVPLVRVLHYDAMSQSLIVDQAITGDCPSCACSEPPSCDACMPSADTVTTPCGLSSGLRSDTLFTLAAGDVDGDGFTDLAFTVDQVATTYLGIGRGATKLLGGCSCAKYGKALDVFNLIRIGGPGVVMSDPSLLKETSVVVGDLTGAYIGYPGGPVIDGPSCSGPMDQCPMGTVCTKHCGPDQMTGKQPSMWRCLQPCDPSRMGMDCTASPLKTVCMPLTSTAAYCAGPKLQCAEPPTVWPFVNVHHVAKGKFGDGTFEDAIAVGSGSPVPGVEGQGELRIIFGDRLDLDQTKLMQQPADVIARSALDLVPRPFAGRMPPQKPRWVEVGDFNGDSFDDLAVMFAGTSEIHLWLGGGNRGAGEIDQGAVLDCQSNCAAQRCTTFEQFAVGDFDGDHKSEVVGVCKPETDGMGKPTLRWYKPNPLH
jgi:hypothetical protein